MKKLLFVSDPSPTLYKNHIGQSYTITYDQNNYDSKKVCVGPGFKSSQYKHYENHEENEKLPATNFTYHIECFTINDAEMIFEALENWKAVVQARTFTGQEPEPKQNKSNFSNNHRPHGSEKNWPPTLVGVTGLCHLLQISDRQARRLLSAGKLPPAHVNLTGTLKGRRWNSEQLVKFLESHSRTS